MNTNQSTSQQSANAVPVAPQQGSRDSTGLYYSTHIKITDPQSGEVLLHTQSE